MKEEILKVLSNIEVSPDDDYMVVLAKIVSHLTNELSIQSSFGLIVFETEKPKSPSFVFDCDHETSGIALKATLERHEENKSNSHNYDLKTNEDKLH